MERTAQLEDDRRAEESSEQGNLGDFSLAEADHVRRAGIRRMRSLAAKKLLICQASTQI